MIKGDSLNRRSTVILQNTKLAKALQKEHLEVCLEPDNYMPIWSKRNIRYITVVHDLQAIHFPENFKKSKLIWLRLNWKNVFDNSKKIIAISEYTKKDIINHFHVQKDRIDVIYDPIVIRDDEITDFDPISQKYNIKKNEYYYTVSSLAKNKNLITLLHMMRILKSNGINKKLVISGIGSGASAERFYSLLDEMGLSDFVLLTGFVDNATRNSLYQNCEYFLFPSIFEGFGMPPLEASVFGAKVITTNLSSIPEATQGALYYVNDALDPNEGVNAVISGYSSPNSSIDFTKYDIRVIAKQYLEAIREISTL